MYFVPFPPRKIPVGVHGQTSIIKKPCVQSYLQVKFDIVKLSIMFRYDLFCFTRLIDSI